ncbi:methyltransferase [Aureibaculum algae]|uniref:tRNA1(Val) (adenine(37)-N6)-methyltransferase n=1 Tax=Aureibaculum algae TaxID=2584122 RepID=A0A5B7TRD2_9FLAO|nr:methyltransferase [Aureibaculum algae]QCX37716.1 methyltransferase [Aureibaculum algae]
MNKHFSFKQFTVNQDQCAMKIGTDGVLLGAWSSIKHNPESILDIGTGTGVIALQLAQRSDAEIIDAIEIDDNAFEQAVENFENSSWGDRLFCYHASLEEFTNEIDDHYDLIISNPPFYNDAFQSDDNARNTARFTDSLPFDILLKSVSKLLSSHGIFTVIIPFKEEENFINLAKEHNLFVNTICNVKGTPTSDIKRSLLEFSFTENEVIIEDLVIETTRHQYTDTYIELVKDFYLKM